MASSNTKNQPLSINQILRQNPGDRLLVEPLKWTHEHLQHLEISFEEPVAFHEPDLADTARGSAKLLETVAFGDVEERDKALEDLISKADDSLIVRDDLNFYFEGEPKLALQCMSFYEIGEDYPIAAHVDHETILKMKANKLKSKMNVKSTTTTLDISKAKLKSKLNKVTPDNPLFDPVIPATLIALAQERQKAEMSRPDSKDNQDITQQALKALASDGKEYKTRVLSNCYTRTCFLVYSAVFPSSFLAKFNDPDYAPPESTPILIKVMDIPFVPYVSLHRRVFNDLFPDRDGIRSDSDQPTSGSIISGSEISDKSFDS